jgi:hypothetical protein
LFVLHVLHNDKTLVVGIVFGHHRLRQMEKKRSANAQQTQLKMGTVIIMKQVAMITQRAATVKNMHVDV